MKYPYQNISLESIEGEEWDDIPGLDGYFLISNFGRIKRQRYEMQYRNGAIYVKEEKIIRPQIVRGKNKFKKDFQYFLTGRVTVSGKRHTFTISRMVYNCFVNPFDMENQDHVIICQDTDNFNIHPSNLRLVTKSQKQRRTIDRKRFRSPLLDMSETDRLKQREEIIKKQRKQVTQYSKSGKKIKTYRSAADAQRATGVFSTSIGQVALGEKLSAGGFVWRFGKETNVDVITLKEEKRKAYLEKNGTKVTQYDLAGKKIAQYLCIKDAAEASGVTQSAIYQVLLGQYKSAKGFYWKKGYGKDYIDLSNHKWGKASMAETQSIRVKQFDLEGNYVQSFQSVKRAAENIGVSESSLIGALKGRQKTSGGYKWKYARPDKKRSS